MSPSVVVKRKSSMCHPWIRRSECACHCCALGINKEIGIALKRGIRNGCSWIQRQKQFYLHPRQQHSLQHHECVCNTINSTWIPSIIHISVIVMKMELCQIMLQALQPVLNWNNHNLSWNSLVWVSHFQQCTFQVVLGDILFHKWLNSTISRCSTDISAE